MAAFPFSMEPDKLISLDQSSSQFGGDPNDDEFTNWGDNVHIHGIHKHHPTTYDEVSR